MNLNGKNMVFVSGFGGIGFEACKQLMPKNVANFTILDIRENDETLQTLQALNRETKVQFIKCDIADKSSIKKAMDLVAKSIEYIDVLVNGAGVLVDRCIELTINVNLIGLINTTMEALPYMDKSQQGRGDVVVNIASLAGLVPCPPMAIYCASKFGVVGFTRSLAVPIITVVLTAICPGLTDTPLKADHRGVDTFEYSKPLMDAIYSAPRQSAAKAAEHLVKTIEMAQNDSLWISDQGTMSKVDSERFMKF